MKRFLASALALLGGAGVLYLTRSGGSGSGEVARPDRAPLDSLGYLSTTSVSPEDEDKVGVTLHDPTLAAPGFNLVSMTTHEEARLLDMNGSLVHQWKADTSPFIWSREENRCTPKNHPERRVRGAQCGWSQVRMTADGDLLAIQNEQALLKLDWDSNVVWRLPIRAHHDLDIAENGEIYVLANRYEEVSRGDARATILNDQVLVVSPDGEIRSRASVFELLGDRVTDEDFEQARLAGPQEELELKGHGGSTLSDLLHTNSISIVDRRVEGFCDPGDVLIAIRRLDLVALLGADLKEVKWAWGSGEIQGPHQPTLTLAGNVLLFDNGVINGRDRRGGRRYSRIVEVDPAGGEIVWEYRGDPPESFFSHGRGATHELPNGNVLVSDSTSGRAFELTRDRQRVWEFLQGVITGRRGTFYRLERVADSRVEELLSR